MKTILLVEDIELNRDLVTQLLEDAYRLVYATNGLAALQIVADERPDLILMDLSLPLLDGWQATQRLKSDPRFAAIPIVVLSAHAMHGDEERARACGADDFLTKPLDEDRLFESLAHLLRDRADD